jgi:molybdopterin molybdotransferase
MAIVDRIAGPAPDMLTVDDAIERILATFRPLADHQKVALDDALGRVLVEDVPADIDLPPFDTTAMDGYALRAADVATASKDAPVALDVIGHVAAGHVPNKSLERGQAYRILTGAPMPPGADSVVPYEDTDGTGFGGWSGQEGAARAAAERRVRVLAALEHGENVRFKGEVQRRGEIVVRAGSVIRPGEVAVLATFGRPEVWVYRRPRVAIISTGDELVTAAERPGPGQIRDGNAPGLAAQCRQYGALPIPLPIAHDDPDAVRSALLDGVARGADLLITSGGVSMGDFDVVKHVLRSEGSIDFWSIDLRPGKPLAFGRVRGIPILGLPGNPVSSLVTFELFVRPALLRLAGHRRLQKVELRAVALEPIKNSSGRENFMRGIVERRDSPEDGGPEWAVRLTGEQGSNHVTSMARANALVRVPKSQRLVSPGETVRVLMLDWPAL